MRYEHTQTAPLFVLLIAVAISMFVAAIAIPELMVRSLLYVSGGMMLLFAASFRQLTVRDESDCLLISFGPLPLFRRRVVYAEMETAKRGRSTLLDGWGIHISPSGGWTWNLWGYDCVDVCYRRGDRLKKLRIGTDDPAGLEAFLNEQIGNQESERER